MRHGDVYFLDPELRAAFENLLDGRDRGLAAFEAEALGAGVLLVEILLEDLRLNHALENGAPPEFRKIGPVADALDALLDPGLLVRHHAMHVFDADRSGERSVGKEGVSPCSSRGWPYP